MHTLICVTLFLRPGFGGLLRLRFVALPGLFCLPFFIIQCFLNDSIPVLLGFYVLSIPII